MQVTLFTLFISLPITKSSLIDLHSHYRSTLRPLEALFFFETLSNTLQHTRISPLTMLQRDKAVPILSRPSLNRSNQEPPSSLLPFLALLCLSSNKYISSSPMRLSASDSGYLLLGSSADIGLDDVFPGLTGSIGRSWRFVRRR